MTLIVWTLIICCKIWLTYFAFHRGSLVPEVLQDRLDHQYLTEISRELTWKDKKVKKEKLVVTALVEFKKAFAE